jgi:hypothetical protein
LLPRRKQIAGEHDLYVKDEKGLSRCRNWDMPTTPGYPPIRGVTSRAAIPIISFRAYLGYIALEYVPDMTLVHYRQKTSAQGHKL